MLAALKKPVRVISLDYRCLLTPAVVAESTLRLANALLNSQGHLTAPEKAILSKYKNFLERTLAKPKGIVKALKKFKESLSHQEFATLKLVLKEGYARELNIDVSDIVMRRNAKLIEDLRANNDKYIQTIVFIGSDRSSAYLDKLLAHAEDLLYTGHALQVIPRLANMLSAHYDPLLLGNVFPGDAYRGVMDPDKILSLYYQAHKIASQQPNNPVEFQVYSHDSYVGLISAIKACPDLLPKGTTLYLRGYAGEAVTQLLKTKGKAPVDSYYARSIAEIIEGSAMQISKQAPVREIKIGKDKADIKPSHFKHLLGQALKYKLPIPRALGVVRQVLASKLHSTIRHSPRAH
ncbi:MAG: hypothetical protein K0R66_1402 [Gammaproteobacteria bacterium]|jgi:hypothetical protein|nr:hypothetical protein [Gammaproteobacteria bacterium]